MFFIQKQLFFFFCSYSMQVINIPGPPLFSVLLLLLSFWVFWSCGAVLLSSAQKSPMRAYSRTNKVMVRSLELLLSSPLLPHYRQDSQITYTSVFSPRSQYVLILPLPWKNTEINRFINGDVEAGSGGLRSSIRLPFV